MNINFETKHRQVLGMQEKLDAEFEKTHEEINSIRYEFSTNLNKEDG